MRFPAECEAEDWAGAGRAGRVSRSLGHPHAVKLVIWSVLLGVSIVVLRTVFDPAIAWRSTVSHALLEVSGVLVAAGVVYCLWVQYCVSRERWILLTAVAFSGLMLGGLVHALSLAAAFTGYGSLEGLGFRYYAAWQVAAACFLIVAARCTAVEGEQDYHRTGLRTIAAALVLSLCVAAVVLEVGRSWPRIGDAFPGAIAAVAAYLAVALSSSLVVHALSLAALGTALLAFARRYARHEDVFSDGITRYLLLASAGQAARLVSAGTYDLTGWASHVLGLSALLALLVQLWIKFGASYADARARIEHLEAVHHLSSHLNNTLDLGVVLRTLVSDTAGMLSARYASAMLADETGESLATAATHGLPEDALSPGDPHKMGGAGRPDSCLGHVARAFREKRVCVVDDVYTDVEFMPWRLLAHSDGYTVSMPLVYQDVALGVLNLFFDKHVPLNDERIRLFKTLASAGAVAVANAQLYGKSLRGETPDQGPLRFRLAS